MSIDEGFYYFSRDILDYFIERLKDNDQIGGFVLTLEKDGNIYFPICIIPKQLRMQEKFSFNIGSYSETISRIDEALKDIPKRYSLIYTNIETLNENIWNDCNFKNDLIDYSIVITGSANDHSIYITHNGQEVLNSNQRKSKIIDSSAQYILEKFSENNDIILESIDNLIESLILYQTLDIIEDFIISEQKLTKYNQKKPYLFHIPKISKIYLEDGVTQPNILDLGSILVQLKGTIKDLYKNVDHMKEKINEIETN